MRGKLFALGALVVGEETKTARVNTFQQHDARGNTLIGRDGSKRHRRRFRFTGGFGFGEQIGEGFQGFGQKWIGLRSHGVHANGFP